MLAGWTVQDAKAANISAGRGVAVREFPLKSGHGFADYLLYVDGRTAGVIEAKKEGLPLTGVEIQSEKYSVGMPSSIWQVLGILQALILQPEHIEVALLAGDQSTTYRHLRCTFKGSCQ